MKQILAIALLLSILTSCSKNDPPPVTGYNSELNLERIRLYNISYVDSIKAFVSLKFIVPSDTSTTPDTIYLQQNYTLISDLSNQKVHFNTPEKTIATNLDISFLMYNAKADSVNIEQVTYKRNNNVYHKQPLYFNLVDDIFRAPTVSILF